MAAGECADALSFLLRAESMVWRQRAQSARAFSLSMPACSCCWPSIFSLFALQREKREKLSVLCLAKKKTFLGEDDSCWVLIVSPLCLTKRRKVKIHIFTLCKNTYFLGKMMIQKYFFLLHRVETSVCLSLHYAKTRLVVGS